MDIVDILFCLPWDVKAKHLHHPPEHPEGGEQHFHPRASAKNRIHLSCSSLNVRRAPSKNQLGEEKFQLSQL